MSHSEFALVTQSSSPTASAIPFGRSPTRSVVRVVNAAPASAVGVGVGVACAGGRRIVAAQ